MNRKMMIKSLILIISLTLISGCIKKERVKPTSNNALMTTVSRDLLSVAKDIREQNKQLTMLSQKKLANEGIQKPTELDVRSAPPELQKLITLKWTGAVEPPLEIIAKSIGYSYLIPEGKKPANPIMISLSTTDTSVYSVLRDLGLQMGDQAVLYVDTRKKTIKVSYTGRY